MYVVSYAAVICVIMLRSSPLVSREETQVQLVGARESKTGRKQLSPADFCRPFLLSLSLSPRLTVPLGLRG